MEHAIIHVDRRISEYRSATPAVRPVLLPGESLYGAFSRLGTLLGHKTFAWLFERLGIVTGTYDFSLLLFGKHADCLSKRFGFTDISQSVGAFQRHAEHYFQNSGIVVPDKAIRRQLSTPALPAIPRMVYSGKFGFTDLSLFVPLMDFR